MKLSGVTKMVKRQLVCNVFHNIKSDDFYIGTASAIYCATGFPLPLNRSQMGALLGISEDTMIEKVVYNDFDCAYKSDLEGFNLDDNVKNEVEVKKWPSASTTWEKRLSRWRRKIKRWLALSAGRSLRRLKMRSRTMASFDSTKESSATEERTLW